MHDAIRALAHLANTMVTTTIRALGSRRAIALSVRFRTAIEASAPLNALRNDDLKTRLFMIGEVRQRIERCRELAHDRIAPVRRNALLERSTDECDTAIAQPRGKLIRREISIETEVCCDALLCPFIQQRHITESESTMNAMSTALVNRRNAMISVSCTKCETLVRAAMIHMVANTNKCAVTTTFSTSCTELGKYWPSLQHERMLRMCR